MSGAIVSLVNVEKWYGNNHVVKNMNLNILEGEFLTLLGPSGCGKTTTLRMISGFEDPTSGIIKVEGEHIADKEPYQRDVNTVFQNYALFPNMNVFDNIAYGLRVKKVNKAEIGKRVEEMLEMVQLKGFEKRKIDQMSGGQKQRVAIARALINRPKVLLLDEPLGALDLKLRKQMQIELKRLQRQLKITFVFVTHDQEEALTMSDRIAVFNKGIVEQIDTPENIYQKPATRFVANFIGESNIFDAVVTETDGNRIKVGFESGGGTIESNKFRLNEALCVSVRPENMRFSKERVEGFSICGVVKEFIYVGNLIKMVVTTAGGDEIRINRFSKEELAQVGDKVFLYWDMNGAVPIKTETESFNELKTLSSVKE